ncbi:probable ribonuclease ZC3H12B isoform X2 [Galleria mellonella]|nr:probable ribonuclease ZC3H12B isoform X2 [Galleria mellonella]
MSAVKIQMQDKRTRRKTEIKIKKLFERLRNESDSSLNHSEDSTNVTMLSRNNSVSINASNNNSVIVLDDSLKCSNKRQLSNTNMSVSKKRKISTIIINDDTDNVTVPHKNCCTPKSIQNPKSCSTPLSTTTSPIININENCNVTKKINSDSFLTIDLTMDTPKANTDSHVNTIIDLANTTDNQDCTLVTATSANLSMSGDSDVTILENKYNKKKMFNFASCIANLDASDKGKLLELITQSICNGCNVPKKVTRLLNIKDRENQATETVEDTYIKEVILGQSTSRNSIGSNIYNPMRDSKNKTGLRMIIIDGSNVAMEYNKGKKFSVKALKICIDYFLKRGHVVRAFVPRFRCKFGMSSDPRLLDDLERQGLVVYTPSREIQGRRVASYDDRYIVQCAAEFDGIIVSGDNYRDLLHENPRWRSVIETRVLPFTWVNDMIMFPKDPLGRNGPTLEEFLRHPPVTSHVQIF